MHLIFVEGIAIFFSVKKKTFLLDETDETNFKKKKHCGGEFDDVVNPENEARLSNAFSNNK